MEVFISLLIVFALILAGLRFKLGLGLTLILASLALGLLFSVSFSGIIAAFGNTLIEKDLTGSFVTIELIGVLFFISLLEIIMRKSGAFTRLFGSIGYFIKDTRKVTVFFPVLMGTLPSAGGARFSAPLTGQAAQGLNLSAEKKSFTNYWFRHIWEPVFPLYPGIILAAALCKVTVGDFGRQQLIYPVFMVIAGWIIAFWGVPKLLHPADTGKKKREHLFYFFEGLFPIILILIAVLAFKLPLIISLIGVIAAHLVIYKEGRKNLKGNLKEALKLDIVFLILGVMFFKNMLAVSGAVERMVQFFIIMKLPLTVVLFALPFLAGLLTGVVQAYVAIIFPLILPLITAGGNINMPLLSFAFISGYCGVLISPVHLCYLLTCDYFETDINRVYKYLIPLALALPVIGFLLIKIL